MLENVITSAWSFKRSRTLLILFAKVKFRETSITNDFKRGSGSMSLCTVFMIHIAELSIGSVVHIHCLFLSLSKNLVLHLCEPKAVYKVSHKSYFFATHTQKRLTLILWGEYFYSRPPSLPKKSVIFHRKISIFHRKIPIFKTFTPHLPSGYGLW